MKQPKVNERNAGRLLAAAPLLDHGIIPHIPGVTEEMIWAGICREILETSQPTGWLAHLASILRPESWDDKTREEYDRHLRAAGVQTNASQKAAESPVSDSAHILRHQS